MAGPWEKYAAPAATPAGDGPWSKYKAPEVAPAPAAEPQPQEQSFGDRFMNGRLPGVSFSPRQAIDGVAGAVRGAGSIGATIMAPIDMASDALDGKGLSLESNRARRASMTDALRLGGADTDSASFGIGKLSGEIAGTAGVGGALANGLARIPGAAAAVPGVINALRTGGMTTGQTVAPGAINALKDVGVRAIGGAVTGGASAGLVDPEQAKTGAMVGGAAPIVLKGAGALGSGIANTIRGPEVAPNVLKGAQAARNAGLVIPPTQVKPSLANRLLEGFSGKIATAQNASARNQPVLNDMVATELGLPAGQQVTPEILNKVRADAGSVYHEIKTLGTLKGDARFNNQIAGLKGAFEGAGKDFPGLAKPELSRVLDSLKQSEFKASSAVDAIRLLRDKADEAFTAGDKGSAKALRQASAAMEDLVERNLLRINARESLDGILKNGGSMADIGEAAVNNQASAMLQRFRDARQLIAKTYSAEKAMNPTSGNFDARKLAAQLDKGKPLGGGIRAAAEFGQQFPKAAQTVERMGSLPQTSPLDWAVGGSLSAATANPLAMAGVLARPAARALTLSPVIQNRLAQQSTPNALAGLLSNEQLAQLGYQSAPVFTASGR